MMNAEKPDNYVLATKETHSVREFVEKSFKLINVDIKWVGEKENEVGLNSKTNEILVKVDEKYYRPIEIDTLIGDYSKAYENLGWKPTTSFDELIKKMVFHSINKFKN